MSTSCAEKLEVIMKASPSRILEVKGSLTTTNLRELKEHLLVLDETPGPIICDINTLGGDFQAGIEFYYSLRERKNPVYGRVTGKAYSVGFVILQGCRMRFATSDATFQIHAAYADPRGIYIEHDMSEEDYIDLQRKVYRHFQPRLEAGKNGTVKILRERSNILTEKEVEDLMKSDKIFDACTAISYGFLDEIL